jgi:hypothetical protein
MNIHRTVLAVGQKHFTRNSVGMLHRAISEPTLKCRTAASGFRKVDNVIDETFGTCFAQRSSGRPAWESEGFLAHLGRLPLHGFTRVGAALGALYDAVAKNYACQGAATGARLGAFVGGAFALVWSQSMAAVGFAAKLLLLGATGAYFTTMRALDSFNEELAQDAYPPIPSRYVDNSFTNLSDAPVSPSLHSCSSETPKSVML